MTEYIYGRHAILEALRAERRVEEILVARGTHAQGALNELLTLAKNARIPVREMPRAELDKLAHNHQGVLARLGEFVYAEIEDLLAVARERGEPALLLMLDSVQDPQNFGALLRTAEAIGVHGVIIAERRSVGVTPAVVKASAGAVNHLRIARVTNLARTIEELKRANVWVVGVENDPRAQEFDRVDYNMDTAFVLGSEGAGLGRLVSEKCDLLVRLPMWGKIGSLNVAVAGSIILYTAKRGQKPRPEGF
ncbi:MAG: 23S rRNA (guanosine(2251)-2'-O)-methyltransferase RlmB [Chloroflexi bacterium]|nr:23S rRNA (guanosine(2251)-2'-O)-methyltransferase RlmB [Chloroflexota bacterium]